MYSVHPIEMYESCMHACRQISCGLRSLKDTYRQASEHNYKIYSHFNECFCVIVPIAVIALLFITANAKANRALQPLFSLSLF